MKFRSLIVPLLAALVASGCQKEPSATTTSASSAPPSSAAPAAKSEPAAARLVEVTANDQMKFSVATIEVKVGEEIKVKLTNVGMLPKEAMGHNFVLLKPGSDVNAYAAAAMAAREKEYIPDSLNSQVVAHTKLLGPKQSDEVTFKITAAGEYPFLCSFPAHAMAGMKGVLIAK